MRISQWNNPKPLILFFIIRRTQFAIQGKEKHFTSMKSFITQTFKTKGVTGEISFKKFKIACDIFPSVTSFDFCNTYVHHINMREFTFIIHKYIIWKCYIWFFVFRFLCWTKSSSDRHNTVYGPQLRNLRISKIVLRIAVF